MISHLDHLVLTVANLEATGQFYTQVLGMELVTFGENRKALNFGSQKINLHQAEHAYKPHAAAPTPGSADLCFITSTPLSDWLLHLAEHHVAVELGPVERTGAWGTMQSIYLRDPDGNLIELANYSDSL